MTLSPALGDTRLSPQPAAARFPPTSAHHALSPAPTARPTGATSTSPASPQPPHPPQAGHNTAATTSTPTTQPAGSSADPVKGPVRPRAEGSRTRSNRKTGQQLCRFYGTKKGCRAGDKCHFRHDVQRVKEPEDRSEASPRDGGTASAESATQSSSMALQKPDQVSTDSRSTLYAPKDRGVPRPHAQAESQDPRAFQAGQIKKRFGATEDVGHDGALFLQFGMPPSDPDFPFDIDRLECTLRVPAGFPMEPPSLRVTNGEMERGYQLNVERGFSAIWGDLRQKSLLNAMKLLDRRLEQLLTATKAETIRLVPNTAASHASAAPLREPAVVHTATAAQSPSGIGKKEAPRPRRTARQVEEAAARRQTETQQLQQRVGRHPQFKAEADGTIFTVPVVPRASDALPQELRALNAVRLLVPREYHLEPPSIELFDVGSDVGRNVEAAFTRRALAYPDMTLLAQINYLAQNIAAMAKEEPVKPRVELPSHPAAETPGEERVVNAPAASQHESVLDTDKDHVKYIPRPPEWDNPLGSDDDHSDSYDSDDDSEDFDSESEDEVTANASSEQGPVATNTPRETGTLLSLPSLSLQNIELLELSSLSLTLKCDRCKETTDVHNLKPFNSTPDPSTTTSSAPTASASADNGRTVTCRKCAASLYIALRPDLMHSSSTRAGYLDAESCTPLTLLPSTFIPTCATCSTSLSSGATAAPSPSSTLAICRACHTKMSFAYPEVKFLRVGPSSISLPLRASKRPRERLGIVTGTELPARGTCRHYAKSFRWFRFSCCGSVYPCDRCHDEFVQSKEGNGHAQEMANRMICGYCSREQIYRPDACGVCGRSVIKKRGRGFWEGGRGTRDPAAMSRKDPRKYKLKKVQKMKAKERGGRAGGARNA
ncbi:MAG: hypothetical protein Q9162_006562 [Coniocarpon cinnabarinum]